MRMTEPMRDFALRVTHDAQRAGITPEEYCFCLGVLLQQGMQGLADRRAEAVARAN